MAGFILLDDATMDDATIVTMYMFLIVVWMHVSDVGGVDATFQVVGSSIAVGEVNIGITRGMNGSYAVLYVAVTEK